MHFDLYLESGPQHRKTWIYVPGLPGCSGVAPTTDQALGAAAAAIRVRLDFLRAHGEPVADPDPLDLAVAEHVIERKFAGFGQQLFAPDLEPLAAEDAARLLRWAGWSREELITAARAQTIPLAVKPETGGRSGAVILGHVASSEWAYVSSTLGTLPGASAAMAAIEAAGEEPWAALAAERAVVAGRLAALSPQDLTRVVDKGGRPHWTARRMFRRLLEHEWEHVLELRARL
jgi:predicted RNase H-like HicB family nuclease